MTRSHALVPMLMLLFGATFVGGCASGAKFAEVEGRFPELAPDHGRIYFYRDRSPAGSAVKPNIRLNDEIVGRSVPGGFFFVDRPAGNYVVATATETEKRLSFALVANERKYVRTRVSFGVLVGHVTPHLESEAEAKKTLLNAAYVGETSLLLSEGS